MEHGAPSSRRSAGEEGREARVDGGPASSGPLFADSDCPVETVFAQRCAPAPAPRSLRRRPEPPSSALRARSSDNAWQRGLSVTGVDERNFSVSRRYIGHANEQTDIKEAVRTARPPRTKPRAAMPPPAARRPPLAACHAHSAPQPMQSF
jgi:hypothetical protein